MCQWLSRLSCAEQKGQAHTSEPASTPDKSGDQSSPLKMPRLCGDSPQPRPLVLDCRGKDGLQWAQGWCWGGSPARLGELAWAGGRSGAGPTSGRRTAWRATACAASL